MLTNRDEISNLDREPPIDASYQVWIHLAKRFQRRSFFRNWPIRNKNCLWQPCWSMDRDEMRHIYRGPSIDTCTSYQVSVHLAKRFQRCFRNQPIKNKNCLWWPCLLTDRGEMGDLDREPSIGASYLVSVHLAKRIQRNFYLNLNFGV